MKPVYNYFIDNCNDAFDYSSAMEDFVSNVRRIVEDRSYKHIIASPVPLYVTVYFNPTEDKLTSADNGSNGVYILATPEIEGNTTIFAMKLRIAKLSSPTGVHKTLVIFSTSKNIPFLNSNGNHQIDEDETPIFTAKPPKWTFDDIIMSDDMKNRIFKSLAIIKNRELIFSQWGFEKVDKATKSILCFYGPAGTGKTKTAEAIGSYLNKNIIHSSYAEIESQYVGVGAKNLHAIFEQAEEQDAILFFDEADSFLSNRLEKTESSSDKHYNRMSNELFQLLEEFNGCVIFSTNLLTDVDEAFKSRIIDSIKFELPDSNQRIELIKYMIPSSFPLNKLSDDEYTELSQISEGFSGRDIRKSVLLALSNASTKFVDGSKKVFEYEDIKYGFTTVNESKKQMQGFLNDKESIDSIDDVIKKQEFNEKLISMAKLALNADGYIADEEVALLNELSLNLLGAKVQDTQLTEEDTLDNICSNVSDNTEKLQLIDIAIRMSVIDKVIADSEVVLLKDLFKALNVKDIYYDKLLEYAQHLLDTTNEFDAIKDELFE